MFETILTNFHLEKILWVFKVKLKYIILVSILFALAAGAYADYSRTSTYVAQISFYVYSNPDYITDSSVNINSSEVSQAKSLLASYMQILRSKTFLEKVREDTGLPYSASYIRSCISASAVENTPVFVVSVYNPNPVSAMDIANAIGNIAPGEITRIVKSGGIEILDRAELPTAPYQSTNVMKLIILGGIAGFGLATFLCLLRGLLDTTVRKKYEIQDMFNIPILGDIPRLPNSTRRKPFNKILNQESPFALRESYNNIRANLLFTGRGEKCPVYAITSADIAEGKTLNTINVAISYMQLEKKILVIDADMRKSSLSILLDMKEGEGLSEYLAQVVKTPNVRKTFDNLYVLPSGYNPPNPAELLASKRWTELLEYCKTEYDAIFIDLPPVGIVSDAILLAKDVTAYILIVREKVTKFDREQMIVRQLEPLGANICGFIYNGVSMKSEDYTYKNYGKEYAY